MYNFNLLQTLLFFIPTSGELSKLTRDFQVARYSSELLVCLLTRSAEWDCACVYVCVWLPVCPCVCVVCVRALSSLMHYSLMVLHLSQKRDKGQSVCVCVCVC